MMKSYTAYCMNEDGENLCMTREYTSKAHFISDLHGNGYKVHFVALTDKYDEECAKYYERLETKRRRAAIRRECEREWKRRDAEIEKAATEETNEEPTAEEPAAVQEPEEETTETMTLKNYDEVKEQLVELITDFEIRKNRFQTDVYLYIDENGTGTLDTFVNVGGNSWIDDDHITIYSDREHYETIMDELVGGDCGMWEWLIENLESTYGLSDVKEKVFNSLYAEMDEEDRAEYYKSLEDFESYDIEQTLKVLYGDKIKEYYRDYFIPECCMDGIEARAEHALSDYE